MVKRAPLWTYPQKSVTAEKVSRHKVSHDTKQTKLTGVKKKQWKNK